MRSKLALYLGGLYLVCQGCAPLGHVARTVIVEPVRYPLRLDNLVDVCRNEKLAEAAWAEYQANHEDAEFSADFGLGFREGYADYLYAGGTGNPPPLPPRYYWRAEFESPAGHAAIRDWFAGFKLGSEAAKRSGFRELVTIPTPLPGLAPPSPPALPAGPPPADEALPLPRKMPPAAAGPPTDADFVPAEEQGQ